MHAIDASTPVVVLRLVRGLFPHGSLSVVRTLGRLGVSMWGFHDDRWAPAAFSRYDRGKLAVRLDASAPVATVGYLTELGRRLGTRSILIPTEDVSCLFIEDHAHALKRWFIFPERPHRLSRSLANKQGLYSLCRQLHVPTPETVFPQSLGDVRLFIRSATFPIVLKSIDPEVLQQRPNARSTVVTHDAEELIRIYKQMEMIERPNLMLQEYIPGDLSSHWMVSAYFNEKSECLVAFTGQKLRESRPGAGFTTLGVCARNERVERDTCNFLKGLGYRGVVDAEWRYDARDRQYKLIDVNPRPGSQFRAFVGTDGMDAVRALYLDLTGQRIPPAPAHEGRRWVVENHDTVASALYWRRGGLSLKDWATSFRGVQERAWFARDDPAPFWMMCVRALFEVSRRAVAGEELVRDAGKETRTRATSPH